MDLKQQKSFVMKDKGELFFCCPKTTRYLYCPRFARRNKRKIARSDFFYLKSELTNTIYTILGRAAIVTKRLMYNNTEGFFVV